MFQYVIVQVKLVTLEEIINEIMDIKKKNTSVKYFIHKIVSLRLFAFHILQIETMFLSRIITFCCNNLVLVQLSHRPLL